MKAEQEAPGVLDQALGERIREAVRIVGEDKAVAATGKSARTLARYIAGTEPPVSAVRELAAAASLRIEWLITGHGPRDMRAELSQSESRTQPEHGGDPMLQLTDAHALEASSLVLLPRLEISAAAGAGRVIESHPELKGYVALSEEYLRSIGVPPRFARLVEIEGDSMFPTLKDRDVAVIDTSITEVRSDAVYAIAHGGLLLVKRVQIARDGSITLSSDNKLAGYKDERIPASERHDLHVAGRVKGRLGSI